MSNTITTVANGGTGITAGPHHGGLKTTITTVNGVPGNLSAPLLSNGGFTFTQPSSDFKAGTITIKGEGNEQAEFDAAFINDLKLLLEVIQEVPDEHPLGDLKHDMRMRRAFKLLGG